MSNPRNPRPLEPIFTELVAAGFPPEGTFIRAMRDLLTRNDKVLTDKGEIQAVAPVVGRTEGLGITVTNLTSSGQLNSADNVAADGSTYGRIVVTALTSGQPDLAKAGVIGKTTDNLADGTGSPLTGGKRGFVALNSANRLADSSRNNPLNVSLASTSVSTLSNDGVSTVIPIAASSNQFGTGTVAYNSGSIDPGGFGVTSYVYADDPTFAGGALAYTFSATPPNQVASDGRIPFGKINTIGGTAKTGGGYSGGNTPGGSNVKGAVA